VIESLSSSLAAWTQSVQRFDGRHRPMDSNCSVSIKLPMNSRETLVLFQVHMLTPAPSAYSACIRLESRLGLLADIFGTRAVLLEGSTIWWASLLFISIPSAPCFPPNGNDVCTSYLSKDSASNRTSLRLKYFRIRELFLTADIQMSFLSLSLFVLCKSVMVLFADQHASHQHSQPVSYAMARY